MTKPIDWRGSSLKDLQAFPDDAKHSAGYQLRKLQQGDQPDEFKPVNDLKSGHITPADGNVFADLGFVPQQAAAMLADADARIAKSLKLKKDAALAIAQWMQSERLTQVAASEILDVSRPRVSDLVNEKLGRFSLDTLVTMLLRTGKSVELVVR